MDRETVVTQQSYVQRGSLNESHWAALRNLN